MSSSPSSPGSQSSLREANAARVVDAVRHYGQITQVELAASTGLSQATISNIVKRLIEDGVVETENTIRSGRRAQLVKLARRTGLVAGVEIGRRRLRIELSDFTFDVTGSQTLPLPVDHRPDTTLDRTALLLMEMVQRIGANPDDLQAVGLTLPAPINPETGMISVPGIMPTWEDVDVSAVLGRRLSLPVVTENDANAAVWSESRFGSLREYDNGLYVRASYSVGAGIISGGQILRGPRGTAGEIGHVQVDPTGLICQCGARGCLNTVVGADIIVDSLRLSRGPISFHEILRAAVEGDPGCRQVVADAGSSVGTILADLALFFAPQCIVIGGELATTGEVFLGPIRDAIAGKHVLGNSIEIAASELGERAEAMGALALALDTINLQNPQAVSEGAV